MFITCIHQKSAILLVSPRRHKPDSAPETPNSTRAHTHTSPSPLSPANWATVAFGGGVNSSHENGRTGDGEHINNGGGGGITKGRGGGDAGKLSSPLPWLRRVLGVQEGGADGGETAGGRRVDFSEEVLGIDRMRLAIRSLAGDNQRSPHSPHSQVICACGRGGGRERNTGWGSSYQLGPTGCTQTSLPTLIYLLH
jgi:hypothetical protein